VVNLSKHIKVNALRQEGYQLFQDGLIELSRIEANGIRIDVPRLQQTKIDIKEKIRTLREELEQEEPWKIWRKLYGSKTNITSRDQLERVLHKEMGYEVLTRTATGRAQMNEEALQEIGLPFTKKLIRLFKYEKAYGTYLKGIEREIVGGRIHPSFNLHLARSFRSSCNDPNFQNMPIRDKEVSELVRGHIISSPGNAIVENDFRGLEVFISAAYHADPVFIKYIKGVNGEDMHKDMAIQIYKLEKVWEKLDPKMAKDIRYGAKNRFVFPQFYGDYYVACARNCWEWIRQGKLKGSDGESLYKHLKRQGISELGECNPEERPRPGTFEAHMKAVEDDFWGRRFKVYNQWRRDWYSAYLEKGYFDLLSGFRVFGSFKKNAVVNYPVQGSAFHCLLWSLIRVNRLLRKHKMKSMIVGQIHDSLVSDVRTSELRDFLEIVEKVTTVDLKETWKWITVPLEIEYEIAPEGANWFQKKEIKTLNDKPGFKNGRFLHPKDPTRSTTDPIKFLKTLAI